MYIRALFLHFMTLYQKARAVDHLFSKLDKEVQKFSSSTHLHCLLGCGRCCTKPDIDATILEFLPMAMHYYLSGRGEEMLQKLKVAGSTCHVFVLTNSDMGTGFCSEYAYRGLTFRLFGFSARRDKNGSLQLYTCREMKQNQPQEFAEATASVNESVKVAVVSDYYRKLANIDAGLCSESYPMNIAVTKALEYVMHYYAYRRPPRKLPKAI